MENVERVKRPYIFFVALMTALSASLFFIEVLLPKPLPFIKIGLSNIIVLILVFTAFYREALIVAVAKSVIGSFMTGTLFSPTFLLSLTGGVMACAFMIVCFRYLKGLSIFGLSVIGAFVHLVSQLVLVGFLMERFMGTSSLFMLYPLIAVSAVVTGLLTGFVGYYFLKYIDIRSYYAKTCH